MICVNNYDLNGTFQVVTWLLDVLDTSSQSVRSSLYFFFSMDRMQVTPQALVSIKPLNTALCFDGSC